MHPRTSPTMHARRGRRRPVAPSDACRPTPAPSPVCNPRPSSVCDPRPLTATRAPHFVTRCPPAYLPIMHAAPRDQPNTHLFIARPPRACLAGFLSFYLAHSSVQPRHTAPACPCPVAPNPVACPPHRCVLSLPPCAMQSHFFVRPQHPHRARTAALQITLPCPYPRVHPST